MEDDFAWTVPLIQAGFGILFLVAWRADAAREARDWGAGFLLTACAFAVSLLTPVLPGPWTLAAADVSFAVAFSCFGAALVARFGRRDYPRLRRLLLLAAIVAPLWGLFGARTLRAEIVSSDLGCAAQLIIPLVLLVRWPARWIDRALILLSWLVVLTNLGRMLTAPLPGGAILSAFPGTLYSYIMYVDAMLTGCAFAILALIAVTAELLAGYRREAHADPLTGLLNRRGFDAATAGSESGGVVSCDLDHFKRVNDQHGHAVGDRVLATFAELIGTMLPQGAVAARLGGEEFVLYLPGASLDQAQEAAARLRATMARHDWRSTGIGWRQSASFGVAAHRGGASSLPDSLSAADAHLYEAKRRGRDRVHSALAA